MTLSAVLFLLPGIFEEAALYAPSPYDAHGWAVRVRAKGMAGPFFRCESPSHPALEIIIINKSKEAREYTFLDHDVLVTKELSASLKQPSREYALRHLEPIPPWKGIVRRKLQPGERKSRFLTLHEFGYRRFLEAGEYTAQVKFQSDQGVVFSPPWKITVVDVRPDAVLDSHPIKGYMKHMANWPEAARARACVQQVKIGERFFLLQRFFSEPKQGGVLTSTQQVAELPGKVEMSVEGEYGKDKPLIIRYRTSPTVTTTLTIDSGNGTVWDRSDRPARDGDLRPITSSRPVKP